MAVAREPGILSQTLEWFDPWIHNTLINIIQAAIPGFRPEGALRSLIETVEQLRSRARSSDDDLQLANEELQVAKYALLRRRLDIARDVEARKQATHHEYTREQLDRRLRPFHDLLAREPIRSSRVAEIPRLSEYLTAQAIQGQRHEELSPRAFDEKFGVLYAPTLFLADLAAFRKACFDRRCALIVAYLDIDDLKKVNSRLTETIVDERILPRFMTAIEAWIYQHGFAYRMGGDEYAVVLPNMDDRLGAAFFHRLRQQLRAIDYFDASVSITVSIGACVLGDECFLTEKEIQLATNRAKNSAKELGKNCVAAAYIARDALSPPSEFSVWDEPQSRTP